jgi:CheY-like chemotaxis protein
MKVLIVDDHISSAFITGQLFEILGHDVHIVHSALDALMVVEDVQPDLVMVDISMPDIDGYELCRRLRKLPVARNICIIAQSGWCNEDNLEQAEEAGFNQYLIKPVELNALQALLSSFDTVTSQSSN